MRSVEKLPASIRRYRNLGGVLDFALFEEAVGSEDEILSAVPQALRGHRVYDREKRRRLGGRRIDERAFFGEWYDPESSAILRLGHHFGGGRIFKDPKLLDIDGIKLLNSSMPLPEPGEGGIFLFTIHVPAIQRLTVIAGSTTD